MIGGAPSYVQYGAIAVGAAGGEDVLVVRLAVGLPVPLKEALGAQLHLAVGADEVLRVPGLAQGRHNLNPKAKHKTIGKENTPGHITSSKYNRFSGSSVKYCSL